MADLTESLKAQIQRSETRLELASLEKTDEGQHIVPALPASALPLLGAGFIDELSLRISGETIHPTFVFQDEQLLMELPAALDTNDAELVFEYPALPQRLAESLAILDERSRKLHSTMKWEDTPLFMTVFTASFGSGDAVIKKPAIVRSCLLPDGHSMSSVLPKGGARKLSFTFALLGAVDARITVKLADANTSEILHEEEFGTESLGAWQSVELPVPAAESADIACTFSVHGDQGTVVLGEPMVIETTEASNSDKRPNIVLISLDTFRGDSLGVVGYSRDTTPNIDAIAEEGVTFKKAYSHSGVTWLSHQNMLSGYHAHTLHYLTDGWENDRNTHFPQSVPFIADVLRKQGYITAAFPQLSGTFIGIWRGMDITAANGYHRFDTESGRTFKDTEWRSVGLEWLKRLADSEAPFFLFLHTYYPHNPYSALGHDDKFPEGDTGRYTFKDFGFGSIPDEYISIKDLKTEMEQHPEDIFQQIRLIYDRGLRGTDDHVGYVYEALKELGLLENTVLIITSDHGEKFGEHGGKLDHGMLFHTDLHVPLVIAGPGVNAKGRVVGQRVSLIDLAPTIFDLADITYAARDYPGRTLLPMLNGDPEPEKARYHLSSVFRDFSINFDQKKFMMQWGLGFFFNKQGIGREIPNEDNVLARPTYNRGNLLKTQGVLLAAIGEGLPGWKLLVIPRPDTQFALQRAGGFNETGVELGQGFSRTPGFVIKKNVREAVIKTPTLFLFEAGRDDELAFDIRHKGRPAEVRILGKELRTQSSPLRISALQTGRPEYGDVIDLLSGNGFYGVYMWYGPVDFAVNAEIQSGEISEEELQQLRDLGYIQ